MKIVRLTKAETDPFVLQKHYARRPCIFWAGFGLVIDGWVEGVVVYGQPSPPISRHAFSERSFKLYELSRLVVQTRHKNAASFLVGRSLALLESECAVVSYADSEMGHCGIVYQATNWLYTGATVSHDHAYLVDGKRVHPMTLRDMGVTNPKRWARDNGIATVKPEPKHRYFYLKGSRQQLRSMRATLRYTVLPSYPKLPKQTYDAGPRLAIRAPHTAPETTDIFG